MFSDFPFRLHDVTFRLFQSGEVHLRPVWVVSWKWSGDKSISLVTKLKDLGIEARFTAVGRDSSLLHCVQTGFGARTPSYLTRGSFFVGTAAGAWSWSLTQSSAEFKNEWNHTSAPSHVFMEWTLIKHKDNLRFYLLQVLTRMTVSLLKKD
jgi:hypothetical protein